MTQIPSLHSRTTRNWTAGFLAALWSITAAPVADDLKFTDLQERDIERRLLAGLDDKFR